MTFSCGNHDFETDSCTKLKTKCIMGRRGCVLEGKVRVSEEILKRLEELEKTAAIKKSRPRPRR
ncbi:MAG: hypothetical protein L3J03_09790 [Desulfobacterales bacterium]|nr:hypothetical protein [Desulfobacterales bacterium]